MTRILKSSRVWLYCKAHKEFTEHMVYLKDTGEEIRRCLKCAHTKPWEYPLYGRQFNNTIMPKRYDKNSGHRYGRQVA